MAQAVKAKRLSDMLQLLAGSSANGAMGRVNELDISPRAPWCGVLYAAPNYLISQARILN
jgi:hypothetical protein